LSKDTGRGSKSFRLVSAKFRDKSYSESILVMDEARYEMELRQLTGRRKKEETVVARFRVEPTASVLVDGPHLKVAELSITFTSATATQEVAELLRRPAKEREFMILLSEGESSVKDFLVTRQEAMAFLSAMRVDPRRALVAAQSAWPLDDDTREPLEAIISNYSGRLAVSLEKMNSSLEMTKKQLGPTVAKRLYALAYAIGTLQNTLFRGDSDLVQEITALSELGIVTTVQELRAGVMAEKLIQRAHPAISAIATASRSGA